MKTKIKNNRLAYVVVILAGFYLTLFLPKITLGMGPMDIPTDAFLPLGDLIKENPALFDINSGIINTILDTSNAGKALVAPGELLPIAIKLVNFGGGKRVDVLLQYIILSKTGEKIYESSETVAVETTASFIKTIQVPFGTTPGVYSAETSIVYKGQLVPATSEFPFTVEKKILGVFQNTFFIYAGALLLLVLLFLLMAYIFVRHRRVMRLAPFDYREIPGEKRIFYEILSDTIMTMRGRVGYKALLIASHIDGLKIDTETGRVLALTEPPAKIVAALVSEYENLLGKKVSFSFRKEQADL